MNWNKKYSIKKNSIKKKCQISRTTKLKNKLLVYFLNPSTVVSTKESKFINQFHFSVAFVTFISRVLVISI